jgi:phosphatidylinositol dimannoside acyltransferase
MTGRFSAAELGYAAGWRLVRALPEPVAAGVFRAVADRAYRKRGPGTERLARNLRRVVGPEVSDEEFDGLLRDAVRSYARYWREAFRLPSYPVERIMREFQIDRAHVLGDAVESGTGVIIALSHSGNWDMAGAWVCGNGWGLTTVAERLKPEGVYQRFLAYRRSLGMQIVPTSGGDRPPFDVLVDALRESHVVPLLADRDLSARGIEVDFFGGKTRMPAGPAMLALRTGAPLVAVPLWFDGPLNRGEVVGPLPVPPPEAGALNQRVRILTQTIADTLAAAIAKHPTDWHMLQKMWLDDRGGRPVAEAGEASGAAL